MSQSVRLEDLREGPQFLVMQCEEVAGRDIVPYPKDSGIVLHRPAIPQHQVRSPEPIHGPHFADGENAFEGTLADPRPGLVRVKP